MGNTFIIDETGLKTYDIADRQGKIYGSFSFNPSDTNIIYRYENVVAALEKIACDLQTKEGLTGLDAIKEFDVIISEQINNLLGSDDASQALFSVMGALTPLPSGQWYLEVVLSAIRKVIEDETGERVKKFNAKIKKHTAKYHR